MADGGRGQRRVHERVGRVNDDAVAVADRRLDLADRARVAKRVWHDVGEHELRAVLVLDEHHDLRVARCEYVLCVQNTISGLASLA